RQLVGARAPIVLVPLRGDAPLAAGVAPGLAEVGAFLPYTPLHHRLLDAFGGPLVMTSGNRSEEPIAARNGEARERLAGLADRRLVHDRRIEARVEDSVVRWMAGAPRVLRRARGFAPDAIELPVEAPPLLAVGADLKNALCLAAGRSAILAPHTGDLAHPETRALFAETRAALERTFRIRPQVVAHDLHPGHHGSALARAMRLPRIAVQHHHAHVAACLAEHGRCGPVIGVAWDGTGLGTDGTIWGGEFLVADLVGFERVARLRPVPLPGGDAAVRAPWRMAVAHLVESGLATDRIRDVDASREAVETLARRGWNAPPTSSAGRLFDAVAALLGVRGRASYEGQAASELEALATSREGPGYPLPVAESEASALLELDARPLVRAIVEDLDAGVARSVVAGRFHAALADAIARACERIRDATSLDAVALTGGCFQNRWLLEGAIAALGAAGFEVLAHREVPAGDGGIALGQAAVAAARSGREA
ncbi:MAG: carbamoyltransferase HypF, partial [Myxococcales bacterium]|nr:carbamoyltransferase HypF [Myxococcales bacterium]